MRAGWVVAGAVAAAGVALGGLGLVIARRLTAPVSRRRYDLTIRDVDDSGERPIVILDPPPPGPSDPPPASEAPHRGWHPRRAARNEGLYAVSQPQPCPPG